MDCSISFAFDKTSSPILAMAMLDDDITNPLGGGGVLPNISCISMSCYEGYGFEAVWSGMRNECFGLQ